MDMTIFCPDCGHPHPLASTHTQFALTCVRCEIQIAVRIGERDILTTRQEYSDRRIH